MRATYGTAIIVADRDITRRTAMPSHFERSIYYEKRARHLVGTAQAACAPPEMRFILLRKARQFTIRARVLKLKAVS